MGPIENVVSCALCGRRFRVEPGQEQQVARMVASHRCDPTRRLERSGEPTTAPATSSGVVPQPSSPGDELLRARGGCPPTPRLRLADVDEAIRHAWSTYVHNRTASGGAHARAACERLDAWLDYRRRMGPRTT